jgi:nucleoside-diphosphate-sugar epimerase
MGPKERFQFLQGDIRSAPVVEKALQGVDAVVHLAAIVGDPACSRQPDVARQVNAEASVRLYDLSRKKGIQRFLFASTCSNYGTMQDPTRFLTEESELRPVSLYAQTKVAVEKALLSDGKGNAPIVTVLRFATLYGLSPRMRWDLTVNEFTMELLTKRKVKIYGEQFWRPYLSVRDAARAIQLVLESPEDRVEAQAFNVGDTSQNYQKGQLVDLICAQVGNHVQIERVQQVEDPRNYRVSFEKIARDLGFRILRTVEDGIREISDAIGQGVVADFDNPVYRN